MLVLLPGFEHDTVAIQASGVISASDYESVLIPAVEAALLDHASIRLWYEFSPAYRSMTASCLWDEAVLSFFHLKDFSQIVVLTDDPLLHNMTAALAAMLPCPTGVFNLSQRQEALNWLAEPSLV